LRFPAHFLLVVAGAAVVGNWVECVLLILFTALEQAFIQQLVERDF
jgi:hypothetical protein